jgi:uncharacterized protein
MTIMLGEAAQTLAAAALPQPYHRLGRSARHSWWRPLLGTLLILVGTPLALAGGFGAVSAVVWLLDGPEDFLVQGAGTETDLALTMVALATLIPMTMLAAWWVQRRPPGTVSSVAGRLRWGWLLVCVLLAVPLLVLGVAVMSVLPGEDLDVSWVGWQRVLIGLAIVVLLVPLQAAGEEYLFRGWLVQAVGSWFRSPWLGIVLSAVLFGLAHGIGTAWGMVDLIFFGVVMAVVTIRTGGLEAAIGLHVVNNVTALGLAVVTGALDVTQTAAAASAPTSFVAMAMTSLYGVLVLWLARRRGLQTHGLVGAGGPAIAVGGPGQVGHQVGPQA